MINKTVNIKTRIKHFIENHYREFLIGIGCVLVGCAAYYLYKRDQRHKNEVAQIAFAQTIAEMHNSQKDSDLWSSVGLAAQTGYRSYNKTIFGPYFLALESEAEVEQGNNAKSLELLELALKELGKKTPLYYVYKTKAALLKLDNEDVAVQTAGYNDLQALAQDEDNKNRDQALYYLGEYYHNQNDTARAQETWKELVTEFQASEDTAMSPWAYLVLPKLQ